MPTSRKMRKDGKVVYIPKAEREKESPSAKENASPQGQGNEKKMERAEKTLNSAKNFADLELYLKKNYGLTIDNRIKQFDFDKTKSSFQAIEQTLKDYPEIKLKDISSSSEISVWELSDYVNVVKTLNSPKFQYNPRYLKSMGDAIDAVNETFVAEELERGKKSIYKNAVPLIKSYIKRLETDYAKELKRIGERIKEVGKSIPKTPQKKYDEAAAKESARKRRERWEKDNGVKLK